MFFMDPKYCIFLIFVICIMYMCIVTHINGGTLKLVSDYTDHNPFDLVTDYKYVKSISPGVTANIDVYKSEYPLVITKNFNTKDSFNYEKDIYDLIVKYQLMDLFPKSIFIDPSETNP